jgi:peptidoglycan/LPS O-acetylase OafA/YrhL
MHKHLSIASNELRYEQYLASSYRPTFDGMRGIGFLLVITAHIPSVPLFPYLQGWTAVWLFFVVSGYLVTMLLVRQEVSTGRIEFVPFLIKRFCRIVPSYWMAILIYGLACFALPQWAEDYEMFMVRLPYYLALVPEYALTEEYNIFLHSWTIGIELKFYLLLPPLLFLMTKNANGRFAMTAIVATLLTAHGSFTAQSYCALLFGVMLALALERPGGYAMIATLTRVPVAVPLAFVIALFVLLRYTEQLTAVALVATYLVAYCILQQAAVLRVLTWQPLVYLGQRSYGAYLLHYLAIRIGYLIFGNDTATGGFLAACFCLAVTVPAAELMYRAIERPGVEFGRRLLSGMTSATVR